jgi:hypothetical protein
LFTAGLHQSPSALGASDWTTADPAELLPCERQAGGRESEVTGCRLSVPGKQPDLVLSASLSSRHHLNVHIVQRPYTMWTPHLLCALRFCPAGNGIWTEVGTWPLRYNQCAPLLEAPPILCLSFLI